MTGVRAGRPLVVAAAVLAVLLAATPGVAPGDGAAPSGVALAASSGVLSSVPDPVEESAPQPEAQPDPQPRAQPAPQPRAQPEPEPDPDPAPEPDPQPEPAPDPEPEPAPEPAPAPRPAPRPDPAPARPRPAPDAASPPPAAARPAAPRPRATAPATPRTSPARPAAPAARSGGSSATAVWEARGRPDRLVIVRRASIDTVVGGRLRRHFVGTPATLTPDRLADYLPADWLTVENGTARLSAAVILSLGVTLDVAEPVRTLVLTGGPTAAQAASVYTGGGRIVLRGVVVTSGDGATGAPMPVGPGRPFVVVSRGGRLDAADSTIGDLGTRVDRTGSAGLTFNGGSTGSLVRTALPRSSVGLKLDRAAGVRLEDVVVSASDADGIVLRGDVDTAMVGVRSEGNGGNGVVVAGESSPRPVTGITTAGNRAFGVVVTGQTGTRIVDVTTRGDAAGGLEIRRSSGITVSGFTAVDQPMGVYTHVGSSAILLEGVSVTGARRGIVVEKTTSDLRLVGSTVSDTQLGVSLGGRGAVLLDVEVADSRTGVAVQRGATDVTVQALRLTGGRDGFVANPGTSGVVLRGLIAEGVADNGVRALSPGAVIQGGSITGSTTGLDVQAATTVTGTAVGQVGTGIRARATGSVRIEDVDVDAGDVGLDVAEGTSVLLVDSRVQAVYSLRGPVEQLGVNDLSLPPVPVLGAIGVPLVLLAVLLELVAVARNRRRGDGPGAPGGPDGTATATRPVPAVAGVGTA